MRMTDLRAGWHVLGNDGRRLGTIREVSQNYVTVSTGGLAQKLHIPASAIGNIERETVHLNVATRDAESMGWEQPPRDDDAVGERETDLERHV
jgi:hypothetical protein